MCGFEQSVTKEQLFLPIIVLRLISEVVRMQVIANKKCTVSIIPPAAARGFKAKLSTKNNNAKQVYACDI